MKKFFILAAFLMISVVSFPQKYTVTNYADTITNAASKAYNLPIVIDNPCYGAFQVYVDHITGSSDSTHVFIQGSIDGTNYHTLGSTLVTTSGSVTITSAAPTDYKVFKVYTTDGGIVWSPSALLTLPYYRFYVTHYASGTIRVKAYFYKKK